ncbi:MAG: hypothetical protein BWY73_00959 [candidate division TA06 bacterium ADurb.Bin417]|uniref:Uncharacterized protein n=1 Tax=candidate division TA06 bacterium ADurb.Bin417 TaxID=1852828 RepID=A0A1V5MFG2_UNCT6|nr:MAG: hypothetical protein BWY73_00959 [candidate division TA06 bacterium ADurb.Bin417]
MGDLGAVHDHRARYVLADDAVGDFDVGKALLRPPVVALLVGRLPGLDVVGAAGEALPELGPILVGDIGPVHVGGRFDAENVLGELGWVEVWPPEGVLDAVFLTPHPVIPVEETHLFPTGPDVVEVGHPVVEGVDPVETGLLEDLHDLFVGADNGAQLRTAPGELLRVLDHLEGDRVAELRPLLHLPEQQVVSQPVEGRLDRQGDHAAGPGLNALAAGNQHLQVGAQNPVINPEPFRTLTDGLADRDLQRQVPAPVEAVARNAGLNADLQAVQGLIIGGLPAPFQLKGIHPDQGLRVVGRKADGRGGGILNRVALPVGVADRLAVDAHRPAVGAQVPGEREGAGHRLFELRGQELVEIKNIEGHPVTDAGLTAGVILEEVLGPRHQLQGVPAVVGTLGVQAIVVDIVAGGHGIAGAGVEGLDRKLEAGVAQQVASREVGLPRRRQVLEGDRGRGRRILDPFGALARVGAGELQFVPTPAGVLDDLNRLVGDYQAVEDGVGALVLRVVADAAVFHGHRLDLNDLAGQAGLEDAGQFVPAVAAAGEVLDEGSGGVGGEPAGRVIVAQRGLQQVPGVGRAIQADPQEEPVGTGRNRVVQFQVHAGRMVGHGEGAARGVVVALDVPAGHVHPVADIVQVIELLHLGEE